MHSKKADNKFANKKLNVFYFVAKVQVCSLILCLKCSQDLQLNVQSSIFASPGQMRNVFC